MTHSTTVSFPGLGIGEFSFSRVAFHLFGRPIYWYALLITVGVFVAFAHALWRSKREGISQDDLIDLAIFILLFGVIGARAYYVATTWGGYDSFLDVIAIWNGGLAIYGGIIAGILTVCVVCRIKKINTLRILDMVGPGVMLAQAIGRWGNFCNGEAFGEVVGEGSLLYPFRMGVVSDFAPAPMQYYHPTFLYESVWNLIGFVLVTLTYKHKKFNGQIILSYLTWYGFGRMFIEGLRTDSLYVGPIRISQLVGLACFVLGGGLLIAGFILQKAGKLPADWFEVRWFQPMRQAVPAGNAPAGEGTKEEITDTAPATAEKDDIGTETEENHNLPQSGTEEETHGNEN